MIGVSDPAGNVWQRVRTYRSRVGDSAPNTIVPVVTPKSLQDKKAFAIRTKASGWVGLIILVTAATMMHPTFASLIAEALIGFLLILMRWLAHFEGRHS